MKRVLFIYNRHAGKNKTWAGLSNIINAMTEEDCLVTAYPTQYRGDAGEAIVRWNKDFDQVVVAGGDGTLSEAIAGAVRLNEQPVIGYIPVGTTNDFSKNLNLPLGDLTALAATAVTGVPHTHDLGRFNGQSFLYVAAFGAFTEIAYSTPQKAKNHLGYNAYVLEVVKNLASIKPYHLKVEYDDNVIEGDFLYGMVTGTSWVLVPETVKFNLTGKLPENCSGKDVILTIIGMIGVDGALYKSMEFTGEGVKNLSMDDRLCICNMAIEAGAKNGIFPVDDITLAYLQDRSEREPVVYEADPDAEYEKVIDIDLAKIVPTVACPHLPENTHPASELHDIKVDQVVIGSCTNGRMEDMEAAYSILNGKKIADGIRCIIIPGTMQIYRECVERGYVTAFIDAGAVVSTPTCGPCLGGYMGILAAGERCIATTNRNFVGRMGHVDSEVYLASPHTAAASALTGYITEYKEA